MCKAWRDQYDSDMLLCEKYAEADLNAVKSYERRHGIQEGRKEGRKEGREEERLSAIRTMLEFGLPKDQILKKYSEDEYAKATHGLMHV